MSLEPEVAVVEAPTEAEDHQPWHDATYFVIFDSFSVDSFPGDLLNHKLKIASICSTLRFFVLRSVVLRSFLVVISTLNALL